MIGPATTSETVNLQSIRDRLAAGEQQHFWRSLEEAAGTPEFEEFLHREFPSQLAVWDDPVGRREFLKLMAGSLALAGLAGCTRSPQEKIVPYVRAPEDAIPGKPQFYATAMPRGGYGYPVLVESHLGRPTKIEGNPEHPATRGGTDIFQQASILDLYDPDRSQTVQHRGTISTWDAFLEVMSEQRKTFVKNKGRGLRILTETVTSPTLAAQLGELLNELPEARWDAFDPLDPGHAHAGAKLAFGKIVDVIYDFKQAQIVLSLDADFLSTMPGSLHYIRDFTDGRRVVQQPATMNRLYVAESTPTITGAMADHRVPVRPSQVAEIGNEIWRRIRSNEKPSIHSTISHLSTAWINAVVDDLMQHRGSSLIVPGAGQPPLVHAIALAINHALGNFGHTIKAIEPVAFRPSHSRTDLSDLAAAMSAAAVQTVVIVGGNPVYNTPASTAFAAALAKVALKIHLSEYEDETSFLCDWHIPAAHYLESWSDVRAFDGTVSIIQPLIAPVYGGKTAHDMLAVLAATPEQSSYELVLSRWRDQQEKVDFGNIWRRALHDGFIAGTQSKVVPVEKISSDLAAAIDQKQTAAAGTLEIDFRPDPTVSDGRFANNAWLQELPKPITKLTWDNVAAISPALAERMSIANGDVLRVTVAERAILAPAWIQPGQADNCVSLTFGYGRARAGRIGTGIGYNAFELLRTGGSWFAAGAIEKTSERRVVATTQQHHNMEGRDIVRVSTFEQFQQPQTRLQAAEAQLSLYPGVPYEGNAWGMVIDQSACIGCNACVIACQAENNIPVVGKEQVAVGREMHWLRIDRYYAGELDDPAVYFQPMMCVHCEQAPCEVVCPVAATVHDSEGTSNMIYNRCVGTRYCSNNCPYKVRRFNYLQFSDETTASLKLQRNPDVTVRSRGVMEKCSYCIQRISQARIESKLDGQLLVADNAVVTACQQACPAQAIQFGNLNAPDSKVQKLKQSALNYSVLGELNTHPRTTYLTRVINPHPDLLKAGTNASLPAAGHAAKGES